MRHLINVTALVLAKWFVVAMLGAFSCAAAPPVLSILQGGVQSSEDGPFVSASYKFAPGDTLHFTFEIGGYLSSKASETQSPKTDLEYRVSAQDAKGVLLAPETREKIEAELNPEDKDWSPKRRASLQLPSYLSAGTYHVVVEVSDRIGKSEASKEFPFQVGGTASPVADSVAIQGLAFYRGERDRTPLEVAAFRAGDSIHARFRMVGFKTGADNQYRLSYSVEVFRPDGKPYLRDASAGRLESTSFYPAPYVPGELDLSTSTDSAKGEYRLVLTVHDQIAQATGHFQSSFTIE